MTEPLTDPLPALVSTEWLASRLGAPDVSVVDGSFYLPAHKRDAAQEELVVAGNLCESGDVFTRDAAGNVVPRRMDRTQVDDVIAFCDAGAYGFSMASHYNARLLPPEVLIDGEQVTLIRERQTYDELVKGQH